MLTHANPGSSALSLVNTRSVWHIWFHRVPKMTMSGQHCPIVQQKNSDYVCIMEYSLQDETQARCFEIFLSSSTEPVNWLLSLRVWTPFARLTYCAYLIHPPMMIVYAVNTSSRTHFGPLNLVWIFEYIIILTE